MRRNFIGIGLCAVVGLALTTTAAFAADDRKDKVDLSGIPKVVMDTLKGKWPKAEIHKWTKEKEGDKVVYDIEFKVDGKNFEADIFENGIIENWEKAIEAKDLPKVVSEAVYKKYPKSTFKEVMEITEVNGKTEKLQGYEIVLETADKKSVEVTVSPEGKIMEDSTDKKEEKK